jgi:hypothetical protein
MAALWFALWLILLDKTGMTIHVGLLDLAAFIRVVIPTLFSSTSTHNSPHNLLERMAACGPVKQDLGESIQLFYPCISDLYQRVERHGNVDIANSILTSLNIRIIANYQTPVCSMTIPLHDQLTS